MSKFYEDFGEDYVGRYYKNKESIMWITSVDVCVGEIHYNLYSNEGTFIEEQCSSIESFSHLERASEKDIEKTISN